MAFLQRYLKKLAIISLCSLGFFTEMRSGLAQGNQTDNQYISLSPSSPISTEPFTVIENSPNVPDGTTVSITVFQNSTSAPSQNNPYAGQVCNVTQTRGSASCLVGRLLPGNYQLYAFASAGQNSVLNAQPLFTVSAPGSNAVSALQGQYAFLIASHASVDGAATGGEAAAGSFTADGQGHITAGIADLITMKGSFNSLPLTGTYQLNSAGQGTISLNSAGKTLKLKLFVPAQQVLSNVTSGSLVTIPGGPITGGGTLTGQSGTLQSSKPVNPGFGPSLNGSYEFKLDGETQSPAEPVGGAGQINFAATGTVTASGQLSVNGSGVDLPKLTGNYTPVDGTTGRTVVTMAESGQPAQIYALYETAQQSFYFLSLSPHAEDSIFWGTGTANQ